MGVLFHLVMADEGAAERIGTTEDIYDEFRVLPTNMLDPLTLNALFSLIDPVSPDIESWDRLLYDDGEGLSVFQLPRHFFEKLAPLSESERDSLAKRWTQAEDVRSTYQLGRLPPDEVAEGIRNLVDEMCVFAREVTEADKQVFLLVVV